MSNKTGTGSTVSKMSHRNEGGCDIRVYNYWLTLKCIKRWELTKNLAVYLRIQCAYYFPKYVKEVFNVQWAWYSRNMLATMIENEIFRWATFRRESTPIRHLATRWLPLWA
jgi:hypothetical protein